MRLALSALALAYALAVTVVLPRSGPLVTSYARASDAAAALGLIAGLSLLAAGALALWERPRSALGPVTLAAGIVWFAPDWDGWEGGPPLARSIGMLLAPLLPALLLHLVTRRRALLAAAYGATVATALALALVRDPFEDEHCWSNCTENVFLVHADQRLADVLGAPWPALALGALTAVLAPRRLWPVALAGALGAAYAVALATATEDPHRTGFAALYLARAASLAAVAAAVVWLAAQGRRTRAAVARVTAAPLRDVLARALGDPGVQVAYPLPGSGRTVDASGAPVDLSGSALTRITRGGQPVAIVAHDARLDGPALEHEIGAAARLAVDNERLEAVVRAQLEELRASRTRIVETGDEARRRLERDLHDGAQQRLLALSFELRLAQAGTERAHAAVLAGAVAETQAALDELRELAHGIFPAILTEAGLEAALETLADTAPVPVELDVAGERFPAPVETAAYLLVAAAVEDAGGPVSVSIGRDGALLRVSIGGGPAEAARAVADRIGALGGSVEARDGAVTAVIPCA